MPEGMTVRYGSLDQQDAQGAGGCEAVTAGNDRNGLRGWFGHELGGALDPPIAIRLPALLTTCL
jgi:hypothetical protein